MGRRMPRTRLAAVPRTQKIALLATVFTIFVAGCGDSDEGTIPSDQSDTLLGLLAEVENNVNIGDCELAEKNAEELVDTVNELPAEVDNEVQGALTRASQQLVAFTENPDECVEGATGEQGAEPDPETTTSTTEATTTSTTPTTTETTTTEEEEPEEEEPTEEPPPEEEPTPPDGGNPGNGGGGGVGPPSGGLEPPDGKR
jgi:hypothetical protein